MKFKFRKKADFSERGMVADARQAGLRVSKTDDIPGLPPRKHL